MKDYFNNFTEALDKHRTILDGKSTDGTPFDDWFIECQKTYLCYHTWELKDGHIAFRIPGATRGHVSFDKDLIITGVTFYEDVCFKNKTPHGVYCYNESVIDEANKFIGTKLDLKNGTKRDW